MADSVNITITSSEEIAVVSAQVTGTPDTVAPDIQEYIGTNGLSAYELWINEGNNGSVADFLLSLKGTKGDQGEAGEKGDRGLQGIQGSDGQKGEKGNKGDAITFNDLTTEQKAELTGPTGPQGNQGERGLQGLKGDDGYTPVKGVDYFDGANGSDGANGLPGSNGKEVEFQKTTTHIQWRYVNESWSNLVALVDIKGADGTNGTNGTNGLNGSDGNDGADGKGISSIDLQGTVGLNKTYRMTFTDSSTYDFTVTDGAAGAAGAKGDTGSQGPAGQNGSDANVTKANVEAALTGDISTHTHSTYLTRDQILNLL